jgi:hypothetical protein
MSKLLRTGLTLLGAGVFCLFGVTTASWGSCGPTNPIGLVALLSAMICFPLGVLFLVIGGIRRLLGKS